MSVIKELLVSMFVMLMVAIISSQLIVVPTESMSPAINDGDIVLVEKTNVLDVFYELDPDDVQEGDIIVYEKPSEAQNDPSKSTERIIHRVKSVKTSYGKKYLILKGDNNRFVDENRVYLSQVKARAILWNGNPILIPKLGHLLFHIKNLVQ